MKLAVIAGWILLVVEALIIGSMLVQPNAGDDAAGRGVARAMALVLTPFLLAAAALFVWGQRSGTRIAFWAGFGVMAIPLAVILRNTVARSVRRLDSAAGKVLDARFPDERLSRIARAIEIDDTATVHAVLAEGPMDFTARSRRGRTIVGRAVEHASDHGASPLAIELVRILLAAGAKPLPNAIEPELNKADLDAHLLVAYLFDGNAANTLPLLDMVLAAGADPDTRNYEGEPLYFATSATLPKLEVLAKHGADFTALETKRTDRIGWNAAMIAAQLQKWDAVIFFLDHGVHADHVAADGASLRAIVKAKKAEGVSHDSLGPVTRRIEAAARTRQR